MDELVRQALAVRERAYAPYSGYRVGAALRDERGEVFVGTNVENVSFGATICAERAAILAMVAGGGTRLSALAVATRDGGPPCGLCLQVISEFADGETPILVADDHGGSTPWTLKDFLPHGFTSTDVERADDPAR